MDYQGNSRKGKEEKSPKPTPEKVIEKVVEGNVIVKKKSLGQRVKDIFIHADPRNVATFVVASVLIPAARNMLYDAGAEAWQRMLYGENAPRRNVGLGGQQPTIISYNRPVERSHTRDPRSAPATPLTPRRAVRGAPSTLSILVETRDDAEMVVEAMQDLISQYEFASVEDLNSLIGAESSFTDNKWGWVFLHETRIYQTRDGYMIDFPAPESMP